MANSVYAINKGINRPIEFRGLQAQYIGWLAGGLLVLLILFAVLYLTGVNAFLCVGIILPAGAGWWLYMLRFSKRYGAYGLMKKLARRQLPRVIKSSHRKLFFFHEDSSQHPAGQKP